MSAGIANERTCCFCGEGNVPVMEVSRNFVYAGAWKLAAGTNAIYACLACFTRDDRCGGEWQEDRSAENGGAA